MQKPRYLSSSVNEPRALPPKQRRGERSLASDDRLSPAFTGTGITCEHSRHILNSEIYASVIKTFYSIISGMYLANHEMKELRPSR